MALRRWLLAELSKRWNQVFRLRALTCAFQGTASSHLAWRALQTSLLPTTLCWQGIALRCLESPRSQGFCERPVRIVFASIHHANGCLWLHFWVYPLEIVTKCKGFVPGIICPINIPFLSIWGLLFSPLDVWKANVETSHLLLKQEIHYF